MLQACSVVNPTTAPPKERERESTGTARDRAQMALDMKKAEQKGNVSAQHHASTHCQVDNHCGHDLTYIHIQDYLGNLAPDSIPKTIEPGHSCEFKHVGDMTKGSSAAVQYRGNNCDWILAWFSPGDNVSSTNKVHTEIGKAGPKNQEFWKTISAKLEQSGPNDSAEYNGYVSNVSIDDASTPAKFKATMALKK